MGQVRGQSSRDIGLHAIAMEGMDRRTGIGKADGGEGVSDRSGKPATGQEEAVTVKPDFAVLLAALFLVGCQTGPVREPAADAVTAYVGQCAAAASTGFSPRGYAASGFALVEQECDGFFDSLAELRQNSDFASTLLVASIPAISSVLQATKAHARTITKMSSGLALADIVVESFAKSYAYSPVLFSIRSAVKASFEKAKEPLLGPLSDSPSARPEQYCLAVYAVQRYASYCSIANIESLVQSALVNADPVEKGASAGSRRSPAQQRAFSVARPATLLPAAPNLVVEPR